MGRRIPQGVEVLVKKASIDAEFKQWLLAERARAAERIGLELQPAETAMLDAVPAAQLEAIIAQTTVPHEHRRAFLGKAAAAMLAALVGADAGTAAAAIRGGMGPAGIRPEVRPESPEPPPEEPVGIAERRVIAIIADQLQIPASQVSLHTSFERDLKVDSSKRESIRTALEKDFQVTIPVQVFADFETVGEAAEDMETRAVVERPVIAEVAEQFGADAGQITRQTSLSDDLQADVLQRARLRRKLAHEFRIYLDWNRFKELDTVGEVIDLVGAGVRKRLEAEAARKKKEEEEQSTPSPVSRGIRPGVPPNRGMRPRVPLSMGIRPGTRKSSWGEGMGGIRPH